jgi:hypothetical protein
VAKRSVGGNSHGKDVWVSPHPNGWQVKRQGNDRASRVTDTQREAITIARVYAQQEGSELVIQRADGRIRDKDSHGDESSKPDKDGRQ